MERRHLFEREMQDRALAEFDDLVRIRELVDWEAFRLQSRGQCDGEVGRGATGVAGAAAQAAAKRHRCALDEEALPVLLRLQEPCVGGPRHETH